MVPSLKLSGHPSPELREKLNHRFDNFDLGNKFYFRINIVL